MPAALAPKPEPQTRKEGSTRRTSAALARDPGPFLNRILRWLSMALVLTAAFLGG